ncbi:MAG: hypothetical protein A3A86_07380 [Elusimicrobia bacterium RIFCSPLOWO2_01_FULL_60_11]|nr:MAG: hypothetical protein A3A86_07380 [Elusimicrobia bacterium RIFCSPLOWO2_01_FULL_60_11]
MEQLALFSPSNESYKIKSVVKRNGRAVLFSPGKIADAIYKAALSVGGQDRGTAETLAARVLTQINRSYSPGATPTVEEIQDLVERVLIEGNHVRTAKAYILYRAERSKVREKKESHVALEDNVPYKLVWKAYSWNVDHDCHTVEKLNRLMRSDGWKKLVADSEAHYHDEVRKAAHAILKNKDLRLMIVAGPSSSGKTTTTMKIGEALSKAGKSFITLNLDHYFKNLEEHPKDEFGDYDYETPHALELGMINDDLSDLIKGKTVKIPRFDFKTGKRKDRAAEFKAGADQIILIDSLHGLYNDLTRSVPREMKFKFYIEALCQIKDEEGNFVRWTDLRLLRRMARDSWQRNYDPVSTIGHWHYVRKSEKAFIVPFVHAADRVFNGSLPYEFAAHKAFLESHFPAILKRYGKDPKKADAYFRAKRVYGLLNSLVKLPDMDFVPKDSLLREFIGGGTYKY